MKTQTLTCNAGHDWTRAPKRGRKPLWCPEHTPSDSVAAPKPRMPESERTTINTHALPKHYAQAFYGVAESYRVSRPDGTAMATEYASYNAAMDAANSLNDGRAALAAIRWEQNA